MDEGIICIEMLYKYQRLALDILNTFGTKTFEKKDVFEKCKSENWNTKNLDNLFYYGFIIESDLKFKINALSMILMCYVEGCDIGEKYRHHLAKMMLNADIANKINVCSKWWGGKIRNYKRFYLEYGIYFIDDDEVIEN